MKTIPSWDRFHFLWVGMSLGAGRIFSFLYGIWYNIPIMGRKKKTKDVSQDPEEGTEMNESPAIPSS